MRGGRASHIDQGPHYRFPARVLERPGVTAFGGRASGRGRRAGSCRKKINFPLTASAPVQGVQQHFYSGTSSA